VVTTGSLSTVLVAPDGSWCQVAHEPDGRGEHQVAETEPQLWSAVETAARLWETLLRPSWEDLGLTADTDGRQWVWINSPEREHTFALEPVPLMTGNQAGTLAFMPTTADLSPLPPPRSSSR
jgi:hypothetical protein